MTSTPSIQASGETPHSVPPRHTSEGRRRFHEGTKDYPTGKPGAQQITGPAKVLALDLEVDPASQTPSGPNPLGKTEMRNPLRSRIRIASLLLLDRISGYGALETFEGQEREILTSIASQLSQSPDARIITFNGAAFDLPIIQGRALVQELFDPHLATLRQRSHTDVHLAFPGRGSLAMISELLGLDIDERELSRAGKCEADVVRTMLIWLYLDAARAGRPDVLHSGWEQLAGVLADGSRPHLSGLFDGVRPAQAHPRSRA